MTTAFENNPGFVPASYHKHQNFKDKLLSEGTPCPGRLSFWYQTSSGEVAARVVDVSHWMDNDEGTYLLAFCHLRNEVRAFKSGRMWYVWDRQTGKAYQTVADWLAQEDKPPVPLEPPTEKQIMEWTKAPSLAPVAEVYALFQRLAENTEMLRAGGGVCECSKEDHRADVYYRGPKKRGQGLTFRASLTYWPYDQFFSSSSEEGQGRMQLVSSQFRSKPWNVHSPKGGQQYFAEFEDAWKYFLSRAAA